MRRPPRVPARLVAAVAAIALAVAAIGVLAVPDVSAGTLRSLVERDQLSHVAVHTTPIADTGGLEVSGATLDLRVVDRVASATHDRLLLVGFDPVGQRVDIVSADEGRLPGSGEALVTDGVAAIGDRIDLAGTEVTVVGIGGSAWWTHEQTVYVSAGTAEAITGHGPDRVGVRYDDAAPVTDERTDELRRAVIAAGGSFVDLPEIVPDGTHPIEADLEEVSTLIGLLGIVAAVVALTLLASTVSTLVTERTRQAAIVRALGSSKRAVRRGLRRPALAAAGVGVLIGLPLGAAVANLVAREVLQRFVGVTPGWGWSPTVSMATALFVLFGARLLAARPARRVAGLQLASALRDRDGAPWGDNRTDALVSRLRIGSEPARLAVRNIWRRKARSLAVVSQVAAGVAALIVVTTLATSVNEFDADELEPWRWEQMVAPSNSGLSFDRVSVETTTGAEAGIVATARVGGEVVDLHGLDADTTAFDSQVETGRWLSRGDPGVVLPRGFARYEGYEIGDRIEVELPTGVVDYPIVGIHRAKAVAVFVEAGVLAADLGRPGAANVVYSDGSADVAEALRAQGSVVDVIDRADATAEGRAARRTITAIFGLVGLIVVGVAAIGLAATVAIGVHERRHEAAAMRAIGASRPMLRRLLLTELVPLGVVGWLVGIVAGRAGARGIIGVFERSSSIEIGTVSPTWVVVPAAAFVVVVVVAVAWSGARRTARSSPAVVLRSAA